MHLLLDILARIWYTEAVIGQEEVGRPTNENHDERSIAMGMTDAQWKSYLRGFIAELERIYRETPNEALKQLIDRLKLDLES